MEPPPTPETSLAAALSSGDDALRRHARALAGASDREALQRQATWLLENAPRSTALPWAGAFQLLGGDPAASAATYESWLEDAEAPAAWHLAQLCGAYARLGDAGAAFRTAARFHSWDLDAAARESAAKGLAHARRKGGGAIEGARPYRLAILGTFNTHPIVPSLLVGAARLGLDLQLYEAEFDQLRYEIADPESALYRHEPDAVILATTARDLRPGVAAEEQAAEWTSLWDALLERTSAHVLQHAFARLEHSPLGHLEVRNGDATTRLAHDVNAHLADAAPARVSLVDYDRAQRRFGTARWTDARQWHWAKEAVSPDAAPYLVEEYLAVLSALAGKTRKVLVLDLDNTTWGGIVGEDGVEGLRVGPPSVEGEAHQALQRYALALKQRGVLLAVCSKNNPEDARAPFRDLEDMVLGLDDFVGFRASWNRKPAEMRALAADLNVGLDSFVFVDDNPVERAMMRRECPEVLTVPLPEDPSGYVAALDRARAFEILAISAEDRLRSDSYVAERNRRSVSATAASPEAFHRSLEMVATVRPFGNPDTTRIVQLAARSNQFNLTTWRLTSADVERLAASPDHATLTVRLRDRFGDYGLVALIVGERRDEALEVAAWAMSCRVIGRTVEDLVLAELERAAARLDCREIVGVYLPTKKNVLVKDLYDRLGFTPAAEGDGTERWRRSVDLDSPTVNPYIEVRRADEEERDG